MAASSSPSTSLAKRPLNSDNALMPPPPPPKRIKRPPKVLDEETYTSALSHIIARDFFPGLLETESQRDYLDALDAGDEDWIDEAERKVREVMSTPRYGRGRRGVSMTPLRGLGSETPRGWAGDTPMSVKRSGLQTPGVGDEDDGPKTDKVEEVDLNLGLTAFQAKYTSEDNESFNKLLDKQNMKRAEKYSWMWNGNKIPSARQIAQAARHQKLLRDSQSQHTPTNHDRQSSGSETSQALTLRPSQDLDARPASIATKNPLNPRNNFMFHAGDDITATHPHLTTVADAAQAASRAPPKSVSYTSTRLQTALNAENEDNDNDNDSIPESPSLSAVDAAISGHPRHRASSTAFAQSDAGEGEGSETPRVNGYGFVDAEPTPSELGIPPSPPPDSNSSIRRKKDRAEFLTSLIEAGNEGSAEGGGGGGVNPFTIRDASKRESLHHRMVDKQLAASRQKQQQPRSSSSSSLASSPAMMGKTPTPRFISAPKFTGTGTPGAVTTRTTRSGSGAQRAGLTPAALQLYDKVGRTPGRVGGGGAFDYSKAVGRARDKDRDKGKVSTTPLGVKKAS